MATWTPGDAIPNFGGARNLTQTSKLEPALGDVLAGMDTAIVAGVAASLGTSAPAAVGLAAADDGAAVVAAKEDHVHQISAALAALFVGSMTFTIGALDSPATDDRVITVQLKDLLGTNIARRVTALLWLSDTDVSAIGTAVDTATVTTGELVKALTTGLAFLVESDASGVIAIKLNKTGTATRFLNCSAQGISDRSASIGWT